MHRSSSPSTRARAAALPPPTPYTVSPAVRAGAGARGEVGVGRVGQGEEQDRPDGLEDHVVDDEGHDPLADDGGGVMGGLCVGAHGALSTASALGQTGRVDEPPLLVGLVPPGSTARPWAPPDVGAEVVVPDRVERPLGRLRRVGKRDDVGPAAAATAATGAGSGARPAGEHRGSASAAPSGAVPVPVPVVVLVVGLFAVPGELDLVGGHPLAAPPSRRPAPRRRAASGGRRRRCRPPCRPRGGGPW